MGQATGVKDSDALDLVITNALVLDYTGIYKADIGVKHGRICGKKQMTRVKLPVLSFFPYLGIGKAGNPDVMNITPGMIVGVTTECIAGEGLILTAGGLDTHIHFICPQQVHYQIRQIRTTLLLNLQPSGTCY